MLRHFDSYALLRRALLLQACLCAAFAQLNALDNLNVFIGGAIAMRALQGASNAVVEITGEALMGKHVVWRSPECSRVRVPPL